jgi:hypothetical protein
MNSFEIAYAAVNIVAARVNEAMAGMYAMLQQVSESFEEQRDTAMIGLQYMLDANLRDLCAIQPIKF